jgi:hypothetical protein
MQKVIHSSSDGKLWLNESIAKGLNSADVCSAYIRSETLGYFFSKIFNIQSKVRVLARWALEDLLTNASDLKTYELCRIHKIDFYIKENFHGKLYGLSPHGVLIGSFNLTDRGFSVSGGGNDEAGVLIENTIETQSYFDSLFSNSIKMDDQLYEKISKFVEANVSNKAKLVWPEEIASILAINSIKSNGKILVNECFASSFNDFLSTQSEATLHDLSLLSISQFEVQDLAYLQSKFRSTKLFKWFIASLHEEGKEVYFGNASALLHDQLFDDPKPYRKDVKTLLANLLSWTQGLNIEEISIDRPNYSQRIRLNK